MSDTLIPMNPATRKAIFDLMHNPILDKLGCLRGTVERPNHEFITWQRTPGKDMDIVHPVLFQQGYVAVQTESTVPAELDVKAVERIGKRVLEQTVQKAMDEWLLRNTAGVEHKDKYPSGILGILPGRCIS